MNDLETISPTITALLCVIKSKKPELSAQLDDRERLRVYYNGVLIELEKNKVIELETVLNSPKMAGLVGKILNGHKLGITDFMGFLI